MTAGQHFSQLCLLHKHHERSSAQLMTHTYSYSLLSYREAQQDAPWDHVPLHCSSVYRRVDIYIYIYLHLLSSLTDCFPNAHLWTSCNTHVLEDQHTRHANEKTGTNRERRPLQGRHFRPRQGRLISRSSLQTEAFPQRRTNEKRSNG